MRVAAILLVLHAGVVLAGDKWTALTPAASMGSVLLAGDPLDPSTLYADDFPAAGIVKSRDGGATWAVTPFRPAASNAFLRKIIVEPANRVTALSWDTPEGKTSVYRSSDGGTSWVTHRFTPVITGLIEDLAVDPANTNMLYAAHPRSCFISCIADSGGISRSTDGGAHWTVSFKGFGIEQVLVDPFGSGTVYAIGQVARRSQNGGATWTSIALPSDTIFRIALDPVVPDVVYASTYYGFWRSDDRGSTWQQLSGWPYFPAWTIAVNPAQRQTIVIGGGSSSGVRRSTDGGKTWQPLNDGLLGAPLAPLQLAWIKVFFAPNGQLYGAADLFGAMTLQPINDRRQRAIRH